MSLNDHIGDIEKTDGIYSLNFVVDDFSILFLHPTIFTIKDSRSSYIINGALSDWRYRLNSNISASSKDITRSQKSLYSRIFMRFNFASCFNRMKTI